MKKFRYHPEIEGLKVNEDGSQVLLNESPVEIKIRKSGNNPFKFWIFKGQQIGLARLVMECWNGMPPTPKLSAKHIDGDYKNYHYSNLQWGANGGNSKNPAKLNPTQRAQVLTKIEAGISDSEIAREYGVSRNAIFNLRKKEEK
ncbi:helix-turn-helix domain-containing protein [Epilithonimonas xixisoli]|uniref:Homeodomain-like domain-containing protein n=1 Tax=Epilithonimonas xixisoli TaxID=1476462 RepID=A0A4R8IH89_9FLAO|nr:helix-turn-helix domain-containing protein [Epilithonimonas xixisoli]TDX86215.1 Homeodomain-like domain-containing protein [Epilithonimonas xixisoli]